MNRPNPPLGTAVSGFSLFSEIGRFTGLLGVDFQLREGHCGSFRPAPMDRIQRAFFRKSPTGWNLHGRARGRRRKNRIFGVWIVGILCISGRICGYIPCEIDEEILSWVSGVSGQRRLISFAQLPATYGEVGFRSPIMEFSTDMVWVEIPVVTDTHRIGLIVKIGGFVYSVF